MEKKDLQQIKEIVEASHEDLHGHSHCYLKTVYPGKFERLMENEPVLHDLASTVRNAPFAAFRWLSRGALLALTLAAIAGAVFFAWRAHVYFSTHAAPPPLPDRRL